ncbi:MAG: class I SAM-dependent methyltransferase [Verrucomicrobiales bacterium]|nr:class I SAM-dependent methyltransferase [Verrucomicrobiales bacterium]
MDRLILFEDDHLLVIRKPAGLNTHSSGPFAGEGIYDWLRRREPRWADLAIMQRLDKETSGVLLFSKSRRANVSLAKQFTRRRILKRYQLLTDRRPPAPEFKAESRIRKGQGRFVSRTESAEDAGEENDGLPAETRFRVLEQRGGCWCVEAEPLTGRTHQIRLHAADCGIPILGDSLYGGGNWHRLCLHACFLGLRHPASNAEITFTDEPDFDAPTRRGLREAVVVPGETTAYRLIHGAADGYPGWYVERLGELLIASSVEEVAGDVPDWLVQLFRDSGASSLYWRHLDRHIRGAAPAAASPRLVRGRAVEGEFGVRENGLTFLMNMGEGYSTGLFLDQRDNRRRLLANWVGPGFPVAPDSLSQATVLNVFAYTCGFSVAAAGAGATTTSLDLSRKYLDWGRRNFAANGMDPTRHDFIYGDAMDWLHRLAKKGRTFDVVILDPPTFSQSKESGVFRAEKDYAELATAAGRVLKPGGVLLASTNSARLEPEAFLTMAQTGLRAAGRECHERMFFPQPPDFPTHRDEPGYLKTVWMRTVRP